MSKDRQTDTTLFADGREGKRRALAELIEAQHEEACMNPAVAQRARSVHPPQPQGQAALRSLPNTTPNTDAAGAANAKPGLLARVYVGRSVDEPADIELLPPAFAPGSGADTGPMPPPGPRQCPQWTAIPARVTKVLYAFGQALQSDLEQGVARRMAGFRSLEEIAALVNLSDPMGILGRAGVARSLGVLRKALGEARLIENRPKRGWRLVGPVEFVFVRGRDAGP